MDLNKNQTKSSSDRFLNFQFKPIQIPLDSTKKSTESLKSTEESLKSSDDQTSQKLLDMSKSSNLPLNLNYKLKADIISVLIKYSALLAGEPIKPDDRKELFDLNTDLIVRLSYLTSVGDNSALGNELPCKDSTKNVTNNLFPESNGGLFFELSSSIRQDINRLLVRNFVFLFLSNRSAIDKEGLIKENNETICALVNLVPKPLQISNRDNIVSSLLKPEKSWNVAKFKFGAVAPPKGLF